eukprot:9030567-Pyramimonas_sp.AAC.1
MAAGKAAETRGRERHVGARPRSKPKQASCHPLGRADGCWVGVALLRRARRRNGLERDGARAVGVAQAPLGEHVVQ